MPDCYLAAMKSGSEHLFPLYQVDAFADQPFGGNPAAVVFLMGPQPDHWLQAFAMEMNLSETAYFMRKDDGFQLRWFTPAFEVDLCGHATLATAHVMWETGLLLPEEEARFFTRSGVLKARKDGDWIGLDFPAEPPVAAPAPKNLARAIGAPIVWSGKNRMDIFLELENEAAVRGLQPDQEALRTLGGRGVIVTALADDPDAPYHFVSRFFAPSAGIAEDPVTGSAHCALAPYWGAKLDRAALVGFQASARGGTVKVRTRGNRVELKGKAVTIFQGVVSQSALPRR
jgi:PhzF family phenazine biosynthesis protein